MDAANPDLGCLGCEWITCERKQFIFCRAMPPIYFKRTTTSNLLFKQLLRALDNIQSIRQVILSGYIHSQLLLKTKTIRTQHGITLLVLLGGELTRRIELDCVAGDLAVPRVIEYLARVHEPVRVERALDASHDVDCVGS